VQILGSRFWGVRGLNQKSKKFRRVPHRELTAKDGSIPSRNKKRKSNLKERDKETDGRKDRRTESTTRNNRLLAEGGDQKQYLQR